MKKIILVVLLMVGTIIIAQERNRRQQGDQRTPFTSEQKSQLMLKKLTLELDLNDSQQKEFKTIIAEKMSKMEAKKTAMKERKEKGVRLTSDERFAMSMKMLDEQMTNRKRMEKILNPKQYEKYIALREEHKVDRMNKRHNNQKGRHQGNFQDSQQGKG